MTRSLRGRARRTGLLYLVMAAIMIFAFMYIPGTFVVSGDAAATAHNILARGTLYRIGILATLLSHLLFIFVALSLYHLFRDVDGRLSLLVLALVCVGVAAELANILNRTAPLVLLSDAAYLEVFTRAQREALAYTFLRLNNSLGQLLMSIWGLWLIPFGMLVIRSGWFPRVLGILLYMAGGAYLVGCVVRLVAPSVYGVISPFIFPFALGELGIVLWMSAAGARARTAPTHHSKEQHVSED
jgi:hypothetical protein